MVHELTPRDDQGGGCVLAETGLEVDVRRDETGAGQRQTVVARTRLGDAVVVSRRNQPVTVHLHFVISNLIQVVGWLPVEGGQPGAPGGVDEVVAQSVESPVATWNALQRRQVIRAVTKQIGVIRVQQRQLLFDVVSAQTVAERGKLI